MPITRFSSGGPFEEKVGYCRVVRAGDTVYVAGTCAQEPTPEGILAQCESVLSRIEAALAQAGAGFEHVVRVNYYLADLREFDVCWPLLAEAFGAHPPAGTAVEAKLIAPEDRIEIEVTAYIGD